MGDQYRAEIEAAVQVVREEARLAEERMLALWAKPLSERIRSGRALGDLTVSSTDRDLGLVHFEPPREDYAFFREGGAVRLSRDAPAHDFHPATLVGLTDRGLTFSTSRAGELAFCEREGWSVDEGLVDLSGFYLDALEELGSTAHGREDICPVLFGEPDERIDMETYDDVLDALEAGGQLDDSQADAVATCLAASPFHLVQGPPGTGKTHTLAQLVEQLLERGHRVLVTAFTHRAIHNALEKIHKVSGDRYPVVKVGDEVYGETFRFPIKASFADTGLSEIDGGYVIGATPFAVRSKRLQAAHFESAVLDETSQLTLPAAAMAMLSADRWFFFGDHRQLPPVSLVHTDDPAGASVFNQLAQQCDPTTLNTTFRLNDALAHWPSETFYHGLLASAEHVAPRRLALKAAPSRHPQRLAPEPSLLAIERGHVGNRSRSDDEADLAADLVFDLLLSGLEAEEVGVVVPFRAQASRIRTLLGGSRFTGPFEQAGKGVTVDTVDRFQGQEREVVIYSFTTSDPSFAEQLGGFLFQPQRLNVAVTRARTKVVLLYSAALREYAEAVRHRDEGAGLFLSLLDTAGRVDEIPSN